jgi:hypothetical protein
MRRFTVVLLAGALVVMAPAVYAGPITLGIGGFGGINIPVVQDDAGSGTLYGLRAPVQLVPMLRVEPFVHFMKNGKYEVDGLGGPFEFDGGDLTAFGISGLLGAPLNTPALGISLVASIGSYKYEEEGYDSETQAGFAGGIDVMIGLGPTTPVGISGRGEILVIPLEDGGSRKHVLLTVGAFYKFGL